ncbi:ATPase family AAA domain-containing protein 1-B [Fopius arisanus]|uniref:ATPase family AAA domain-containing protein 1-B n=2 Tax=Braconidae TaxID=7402 RepID=A0A9R1SYL8_9HYME|nr:PREDICTED: ATPase family AAA domain-containing protein 1-B [Fopius arisanus]XP_011299590.1 PREDICTED: ATPase family AAA domain-containing protein 1-B [Fopius arisanus]XP_011299591.1 PREDICTED: ATPase family AAA domain-containing protein 1-B [Fopius arisanus]
MSVADGANLTRGEMMSLIVRLTIVTAVGFFSMKWIMSQMDPMSKAKKKAKERAESQLRKLGKANSISLSVDTKQLTDYEMMIASHLIDPQDIPVSWEHIAGLDSVIQELKETVILPIRRKELFEDSRLTQAPKGVLLHGPPGCGKTMIAKATARESGTCFINLDVSLLTDKWYGESQKLTAAVFSLAVKIQPCIIFIDEIDSFLRARTSQDHEATAMMKAQFMSLWDGLITDPSCTVIVMGATNRPQDLDRAILRRMPATFHIGLPNEQQRTQVLKLILDKEPTAEDVDAVKLSKLTEGFSGSDLHELCRTASLYRVRDYSREHPNASHQSVPEEDEFHDALRPITHDDLITAFKRMRMSKVQTGGLSNLSKLELD